MHIHKLYRYHCFPLKLMWEKTYKIQRELQVIKRKNYKSSLLLEFLGKYAGGSLVSVRPLCSIDNASG